MASGSKSGHPAGRWPKTYYGAIAYGIAVSGTLLLSLWLGWDVYWIWLTVINLVTYQFYRFDKGQSMRTGALRVPNDMLLLLVLVGGFVGALLGTHWPSTHKVNDSMYKRALAVGAAIQAVIIYVLYLR